MGSGSDLETVTSDDSARGVQCQAVPPPPIAKPRSFRMSGKKRFAAARLAAAVRRPTARGSSNDADPMQRPELYGQYVVQAYNFAT